jgi:aminoglycoside phosphotransferase (APT) family kinase protein
MTTGQRLASYTTLTDVASLGGFGGPDGVAIRLGREARGVDRVRSPRARERRSISRPARLAARRTGGRGPGHPPRRDHPPAARTGLCLSAGLRPLRVELIASRGGATTSSRDSGATMRPMQRPLQSPPHGFALSSADRALLRTAPPAAALNWAAAAVGAGAEVVGVRALEGGTSSAVHALDVRDRAGQMHALVIRRYLREDWRTEEPEAPEREAAALQLVRACPVPTPLLIALDAGGESAGVPALLMTRLSGRVAWTPPDLEAFLRALAAALYEIHATPVLRGGAVPAYAPYEPHLRQPPSWAVRPELWRRAIAIFEGPAPSGAPVFLHRDFHPGNVLWEDGVLRGVVDWVNASVGPPGADLGHCRLNLAGRFGPGAADRCLDLYRELSALDEYHPYWDVAAALGGLGTTYLSDPGPEDEDFLAAALASS